MPDDLCLTSVLFAQADEERRCREHLMSGKVLTISGLTPSGRPRQFSGVVKSVVHGTILHPGHPLMVTIRENISISQE
jgi:hypothetical protein